MTPPEGYITPKHAARIVGCHIATIFRWILKHKVKAVRTNIPGLRRQHFFVCRESLDAMLVVVPANEHKSPTVEVPKTSAWATAFLASRGVG